MVDTSADVRDEFPGEEEDRLRSVLGEALLHDGEDSGDIMVSLVSAQQSGAGHTGLDEVVALNVVNSVWARLEAIKRSRAELGQYQSLVNCEGEFSGLLTQLLADIYHDDRREVSCLHHHSDPGLAGMLRYEY